MTGLVALSPVPQNKRRVWEKRGEGGGERESKRARTRESKERVNGRKTEKKREREREREVGWERHTQERRAQASERDRVRDGVKGRKRDGYTYSEWTHICVRGARRECVGGEKGRQREREKVTKRADG